MAGYGRFETVQELARSGPYALHSARLAGEQEVRFAVKTLDASAYFGDEEAFGRDAAVFLESAAVQRKLAAKENSHWAAVHEQGKTDEAAYYVSDLFQRSLRRLIESKRPISGEELAWIVTGVVDGLLEMRGGAAGGVAAHGRLDAGKVLIGGKGELAASAILLTDPAAPTELSADAEGEDRRAIGAMIYEMVLHRGAPKGGSVPVGPAWSALGGMGEVARGLCERLLNPSAGGAPMTLEEIKTAIAQRPKESGRGGMWKWAVAAALIAAAVGGYVIYSRQIAPRPVEIRDARQDPQVGVRVGEMLESLSTMLATLEAKKTAAQRQESDEATLREVSDTLSQARRDKDRIWSEPRPRDQQESDEMAGKVLSLKTSIDSALAAGAKLQEAWETEEKIDKGQAVSAAEIARLVQKARQSLVVMRGRLHEQEQEFRAAGDEALFQSARDPIQSAIQELDAAAENAKSATANLNEIGQRVQQIAKGSDKLREDARKALDTLAPKLDRFLADAAARSGSFAEGPIRDAWERAVDRVKRAGKWVGARETLVDAEGTLTEIGNAFGAVELAEDEIPIGGDGAAIRSHLESKRQAGIRAALGDPDGLQPPTDAVFQNRLREEKRKYDGYTVAAGTLMKDAKRAVELLGLGYGANEAPRGGDSRTLGALAAGVSTSIAKDLPGIAALFVPAVESVSAIESSRDVTVLKAGLADTGASAGKIMGAWRGLSAAGWPGTTEELGEAGAALRDRVKSSLARVSDQERRNRLEAEAREVLRAMWLAFVKARSGRSSADFEGALDLLAAWTSSGLVEVDPSASGMEGWLRYNVLRREFKESAKKVSAPDARAEGEAIQSLVKKFRADVKSMGLEGELSKEAAEFRGRLDRYEAGNVRDLKASGPGRMDGWKWESEDASDEGRWVVYTTNDPAARFPRLEFVKVKDDVSAGLSSYLCTVEVSIGLFMDLAASRWPDTIRLMGNPDRDSLDQLRGVRGWEITGTRDGRRVTLRKGDMKNGNGWLAPYANVGVVPANLVNVVTYYPNNVNVPAPTLMMPMHFVTPQAAAYLAASIGCRLPSSEEWRNAQGDKPLSGNRSDELFAGQLRLVKEQDVERGLKMSAADIPTKPDEGVFWPTDRGVKPRPSVQEWAPASANQADGYLWFAPVNETAVGATAPPRTFVHLVGNVAEIVCEKPQELDAVAATADGVDKFIRENAKNVDGAVRVIGASAFSDSAVEPGIAYNIGLMPGRTIRWYSDVGFRLAFTARSGAGGASSLVKLLDEAPYLSASR